MFVAAFTGTTVLVLQPLKALLADSHAKSPISSVLLGPDNDGEDELDRRAHLGPNDGALVLRTTPEWFLAHQAAFGRYHSHRRISVVVYDEAHVTASWGEGFRDKLLEVPTAVRAVLSSPERPAIIALSATVLPGDEARLCEMLNIFPAHWRRLPVITRPVYQEFVMVDDNNWAKQASAILPRLQAAKTIVFCQRVKDVEAVVAALAALKPNVRGLTSATKGDMDRDLKWFAATECATLVATNILSMGVDILNIPQVVHFGLPDALDDYVQKMGRAGRGGGDAASLVLFTRTDYESLIWRVFIRQALESRVRLLKACSLMRR